jgi:hypothetical protein
MMFEKFERLLKEYLNQKSRKADGIPSVAWFAHHFIFKQIMLPA